MKIPVLRFTAILAILVLTGCERSELGSKFSKHRAPGIILVTPNGPQDGGDFGPKTLGTKTAGIQEALNHIKALHIKAGAPAHRINDLTIAQGEYDTHETITIPFLGERFSLNAEDSWIRYAGETGDVIVIDSQMNCRFRFGYLSALNSKEGWIVRLKPTDTSVSKGLPEDRVSAVITCTEFEINALVARGWFKEGVNKRAGGILLDATVAPIIWNKISVSELNTCDTGVYLKGNSGSNWVNVWFNHGCNTHLQVGDSSPGPQPYDNRFDMSINSEGVPGSIGARIFGQRNILTTTVHQASPQRDIIFESTAADNLVFTSNLPGGITNNAKLPTNRIISASPVGFSVVTPSLLESGQDTQNHNPYTIEITILNQGEVSTWVKTDAGGIQQKIDSGLFPGQSIILDPGDKIQFDYTMAPTWKWKALR